MPSISECMRFIQWIWDFNIPVDDDTFSTSHITLHSSYKRNRNELEVDSDEMAVCCVNVQSTSCLILNR